MEPNATEETKAGTLVEPTIATAGLTEDETESRIARLEAEKAKLAEERENYRKAYLKASEPQYGDSDDDKIRNLVDERLADSRLAEIAREQDEIIKKALKENKELKLAQLNKTNTPPAAVGTHSEGQPVRDTLVTPEQLEVFKSKGWTDQDIEKYKKNLQRQAGR